MIENEKPENNGKNSLDEDLTKDLDTEIEKELPQAQPGLQHRVRRLFENMQQGAPRPRQEMAKDCTRSLALLIGGTVGAVLLFIGGVLDTHDTANTGEERSWSAKPWKRNRTKSAIRAAKLCNAALECRCRNGQRQL